MKKQQFEKEIKIYSYEYDWLLMMNARNIQIPGFRKNYFNRTMLEMHVGDQTKQYMINMKLKELLDNFSQIENLKYKLTNITSASTDSNSNQQPLFSLLARFDGIENPPKPETKQSALNENKSVDQENNNNDNSTSTNESENK